MVNDDEEFSTRKFLKGLNPFNPVAWAKTFIHLVRFLIITGVVVGLFLGIGYWHGKKSAPVQVDMADTLIILEDPEGKQHKLRIKDGVMTFDDRVVKVGDIPSLKPYGIQLHPKLAAGITSAGNPAAGIALELAHAYRFNLDLLAMIPFIGVGISYDIRLDNVIKIDNTSLGIGIGRDFRDNENSIIAYMAIAF